MGTPETSAAPAGDSSIVSFSTRKEVALAMLGALVIAMNTMGNDGAPAAENQSMLALMAEARDDLTKLLA